MQMHRESHACQLLDIVALTTLLLATLVEPAATAMVAPGATTSLDADRRARRQSRHRLSTMDGHHVASEIVLAAERATTRVVVTSVGLETIGVVGLDVGLEVVCTGER